MIQVRATYGNGGWDAPKTDGSTRDVVMSRPVFDALKEQFKVTGDGDLVFCSRSRTPVDNRNFDTRIWRPLLRQLRLQQRRPYEMRHTAATFWLSSGENPEWVAAQLGHTTTTMLFRTYSRFVPNLTRQDGMAFESMLTKANPMAPVAATTVSVPTHLPAGKPAYH